SKFFRRYRINEVSVRLRKIEQFLLAFHQSQSRHTSCTYGNQRLDDVKTASLRIGIRIEECQDTVAPVADVKDERVQGRNRCQKRNSEITKAHTCHKKNAHGNSRASDGRPQIRLKHDKAKEDHRGDH